MRYSSLLILTTLAFVVRTGLLQAGAAVPVTKPSPQAESVGDLIHQAGSTEDDVVRHRLLRQLEQRRDLDPALRADLAKLLPVVDAWAALGPRVDDRGDTRYLCRFITADIRPEKDGPVEPPAMSAGSPLRPVWAMYRGRMLIWRVVQFGQLNQPGVREIYFAEAHQLLQEARQAFPENRVIRMFLGQPIPWPKSYEPDNRAPRWANLQREGLEKLADVIHWWIAERQVTTGDSAGAFGGGWGDDVEMWRWWTPVLAGFDDPAVNAAQERLSNGVFRRPRMAKGYTSQVFDVEHTNEDTTDTVQPMMYLKPDDTVWKQRATRLTDLMRDLWTGRNQRGYLQFKSIYFSVDQVDLTPARAFDTVYHAAAIQPALLYWQRTGDPAIGALVGEWLKVWIDAAARADNGKPAGILPSAIHWPDGNIGLPGKPWWQPFPLGNNLSGYNWPGGESMRLMTATLLLAWHMTGEERYLGPIRSMAAICLKPHDKADRTEPDSEAWCAAQLAHPGHRSAGWPGLVGSLGDTLAKYRVLSNDSQYDKLLQTGATGYVNYRLTGDTAALESDLLRNAEAFRSNWPAYTSEMRWTDRVMQFTSIYLERATQGAPPPPMPEILYCCATGDPGSPLVFPLNAVRWLTPPRKIAALVTRSTRDRFEAELFHFGDQVRPMAAELYLLKPGAYTFSVRQKAGGKVLATQTLRVTGARTRVEFSLPARIPCEVVVAPGRSW